MTLINFKMILEMTREPKRVFQQIWKHKRGHGDERSNN